MMAEKIQHNVSLTEGTVQRAQEVTSITRRRPGRAGRTSTYQVNARSVPSIVLTTALRLAEGDISRLRIDDDGSVTVVNQSRKR